MSYCRFLRAAGNPTIIISALYAVNVAWIRERPAIVTLPRSRIRRPMQILPLCFDAGTRADVHDAAR
jgi:hypothetical protein